MRATRPAGTLRTMSDIRQIVYASTAANKFTPAELDGLLTQAKLNNARLDVTGMLIYADGSVMQAIEGAPDTIGADPRHKDVTLIADFERDSRDFANWRMAYHHEPHAEAIENCVRLFENRAALLQELNGKSIVGVILGGFLARIERYG
jgi:hypothetical protein